MYLLSTPDAPDILLSKSTDRVWSFLPEQIPYYDSKGFGDFYIFIFIDVIKRGLPDVELLIFGVKCQTTTGNGFLRQDCARMIVNPPTSHTKLP